VSDLVVATKAALRAALQRLRLGRAVRRIARVPLGQAPSRPLLLALYSAWGNEGFSAVPEFLEEIAARAVTTPGPILECGSGVSTLLLGLLAGRRGVVTWTLEHHGAWHARVAAALDAQRIPGVRLCLAPLVDRGAYAWYALPRDLPPRFDLVVCDGPPGETPGGRYGLVPELQGRLPVGSTILLDDTARAAEADTARRWAAEGGFDLDFGARPNGSFAILTRR
jgi:hypothetical protein